MSAIEAGGRSRNTTARATSSSRSASSAGSAAAIVSPMMTEPSAPSDLPPVSASASSIRKSVSGGSAASRSSRRPGEAGVRQPVGHGRDPGRPRPARNTPRRGAAPPGRAGDQRSHRTQPAARTGNQVAQDETIGGAVRPHPQPGREGPRDVRPQRPGPLRHGRSDGEEVGEVDQPVLGQRHVVRPAGAGLADQIAQARDLHLVVERVDLAHEAVPEPADPGHELGRGAEERGDDSRRGVARRRSGRGTAASASCRARRGGSPRGRCRG